MLSDSCGEGFRESVCMRSLTPPTDTDTLTTTRLLRGRHISLRMRSVVGEESSCQPEGLVRHTFFFLVCWPPPVGAPFRLPFSPILNLESMLPCAGGVVVVVR